MKLRAPGITGSTGCSQEIRSGTSSRSHKTSNSETRVSQIRSKVSNKSKESRKIEPQKPDKSASTRHTTTVHTMSMSEKRHELALVKWRHEELESQYQVYLRLKEQENCLKFDQSQLELEQLAGSHKIELETKLFKLEDNQSEFCMKVAKSNSIKLSVPISKVATDRTNAWADSVSSQAPPDIASALGLLAFTTVPISTTTSANLVHVTLESIIMDIGICLNLAVRAFCHCKLLFRLLNYHLIMWFLMHTCYYHHLLFLYRPWVQT